MTDPGAGHEIRFVSGAIALIGILLGTIDALAPTDTVKLFGWFGVMFLFACLLVYELLNLDKDYYELTPPGRMTALLVGEMVGSFWGLWNLVYYLWEMLLGTPLTGASIRVMGPVSVSAPVWWLTTALALFVLVVFAVLVDRLSKDIADGVTGLRPPIDTRLWVIDPALGTTAYGWSADDGFCVSNPQIRYVD